MHMIRLFLKDLKVNSFKKIQHVDNVYVVRSTGTVTWFLVYSQTCSASDLEILDYKTGIFFF